MLETYNKPIIGIVGRPDITGNDEEVIGVYEHYRKAVIKKGGIPILLLPNQNLIYETTKPREMPKLTIDEKEDLIKVINMCDGLIMQGGSKWYEYDEFICNYAIDMDIPLLATCLGMQIMGKVDNDRNNIDDYATFENDTTIDHFQKGIKYVHQIKIEENTLLSLIIDELHIDVNSKHNRHIKKCNSFKVAAVASDGIIEAIEYPWKKFILGVQWHPEKMIDYDEKADKIFSKFIKEASRQLNLENIRN